MSWIANSRIEGNTLLHMSNRLLESFQFFFKQVDSFSDIMENTLENIFSIVTQASIEKCLKSI